MKNKRTYVLRGVKNLEDTQWAKAYLQQADTIRFYIKELKQRMASIGYEVVTDRGDFRGLSVK